MRCCPIINVKVTNTYSICEWSACASTIKCNPASHTRWNGKKARNRRNSWKRKHFWATVIAFPFFDIFKPFFWINLLSDCVRGRKWKKLGMCERRNRHTLCEEGKKKEKLVSSNEGERMIENLWVTLTESRWKLERRRTVVVLEV